MPSRFIQSIVARRSSSTERSMPLRADCAWRRNWMTETPAISCGYWKARNMPALARSSVGHSVTSSPRNSIVPPVTSYSGEPISVLPRVDLPEPLGPMMACTSPAFTVRSRPLRISGRSVARSFAAGRTCSPSTRNSVLVVLSVTAQFYVPVPNYPYRHRRNPPRTWGQALCATLPGCHTVRSRSNT